MKRMVHISDLHFGRTDPLVVARFLAQLPLLQPTLLVVSGDLTQRATEAQFAEARAFLDCIPFPKVVIPGNHDISLWDVARRFLQPLERYRRHIHPDPEPVYRDDEIHVVGINTARSLTWKDGRISQEQIVRIREHLSVPSPPAVRALVTHHPFFPPPESGAEPLGRGERAIRELEDAGIDLLLAGHLHVSGSEAAAVYRTADRGLIVVQAGTTLSLRRRGEANSFNVIDVDGPRVAVVVHVWSDASRAFEPVAMKRYVRRGSAWRRDEGPA